MMTGRRKTIALAAAAALCLASGSGWSKRTGRHEPLQTRTAPRTPIAGPLVELRNNAVLQKGRVRSTEEAVETEGLVGNRSE